MGPGRDAPYGNSGYFDAMICSTKKLSVFERAGFQAAPICVFRSKSSDDRGNWLARFLFLVQPLIP